MSAMKPNYPENSWWVAAVGEEVTRTPLGRWFLDRPVVLYRTEAGEVVALEDRCPHRWAPLSRGCLVGDDIMCPYHGFRFDATGTCTKIPTQQTIPAMARVKTHAVREDGPFVWIWMGDPARAQVTPLPELPFLSGPGWNTMRGYMPVKANYMLIQENVLDLTHFGFLHADTLEQKGWEGGDSEVTVADGTVGYRKQMRQEPVASFLGIPDGIGYGQKADRVDWGHFVSPAVHHAGVDIVDPRPGREARTLRFQITHLTTPESPGRTHYWYALGHDYGEYTPERCAELTDLIVATFTQDKDVLEAVQDVIERDARHADSVEVSVTADRPALQARRILRAMLESEQGRTP
ncbi:MAG: aromatic ring-hydroxylating dioxygenase subunit alpha [Gammaproteobacteria bacterium]|jgi:phenylpropionate dioxygenase-like ring-hydroxylating dioxygenase large terminal subunit|nr:aromatic ring-hydroxylating dioxygenase subunit alpha [Gammaproteobacteria bacterium]MBU0773450.1 aromatic ring-hydroxylating dioxygenase subunit alpha [Gammaproteobacteria bacterium]MBU0856661.1 aromatic ring-hydroxylating dioxygenase subunit alpha [Gammaproteobacteria bacterium]MBU1846809.1 aromatic ring-hydroxylating dioxygenase subunit alpha [Gammaproteobacteria bacterium]